MSLADVPTGTRNLLDDLRNQFEKLAGFRMTLNDGMLEVMANAAEPIATLDSFSRFVHQAGWIDANQMVAMPWLQYGVDSDQYHSLATTFGSEYKKLTGQEIPADALHDAFVKGQTGAGGLLTGSEYAQQLMQDTNLQKTYGWIKFGLDFSQWQQQKLGLRESFGREIQDSEAATLLQYTHKAAGSDAAVRAPGPGGGQQAHSQGAGVGGSLAR